MFHAASCSFLYKHINKYNPKENLRINLINKIHIKEKQRAEMDISISSKSNPKVKNYLYHFHLTCFFLKVTNGMYFQQKRNKSHAVFSIYGFLTSIIIMQPLIIQLMHLSIVSFNGTFNFLLFLDQKL